MGSFILDTKNIVGFLCLFGSLLFLIPIAKAKYRLKLSVVAFVFALLSSLLAYYIETLLLVHISAFTDKRLAILDKGIFFYPIIFFLLILLLAENRKLVTWITVGYILIEISSYFLDAISPILYLTLFIILMRKFKNSGVLPLLGLLILSVVFGTFGRACLVDMDINFGRKMAKHLGYADLRLYFRDDEQSISQKRLKNLQKIRAVIDKYYQENGVYPPILDNQIYTEYSYWFVWEDVPGNGNKLLVNFLEKNFKIDWVKNAEIKKRSDNKSIMVRKGRNLITLQLKEGGISVKVGDEQSWKYPTKERNGKLYVYTCLYSSWPNAFLGFSEGGYAWSNDIIIIHTNPNQKKIQPSQITNENGLIYSPDSGDIRINCNHKDSKGVPYYEW